MGYGMYSHNEAINFVHSFWQDELENGGEERKTNGMVSNYLGPMQVVSKEAEGR